MASRVLWAQKGLVGLEGLEGADGLLGRSPDPGRHHDGKSEGGSWGGVPAVESRPPSPQPSRGLPSPSPGCLPLGARLTQQSPRPLRLNRSVDSPVKTEHCLELAFYHHLIF